MFDRTSTTLLGLLAAGALTLAACGGSTPEAEPEAGGVASISEDAPTEETSQAEDASDVEAPEDPEDAFALFNDCMADAGFEMFTSFSGEGGAVSIDELEVPDGADPQAGSIEDFDPEAFNAANSECEEHLSNVTGGFDLDPEQQAAFDDAQLKWADCMEEAGIEVPDFDSGGVGTIVVEVGGEDDPQGGPAFGSDDFDFEAFQEAASECDRFFSDIPGLDIGPDAEGS